MKGAKSHEPAGGHGEQYLGVANEWVDLGQFIRSHGKQIYQCLEHLETDTHMPFQMKPDLWKSYKCHMKSWKQHR